MKRPLIRWHGGKWKLAASIIQHFPPHRIYVEPYGGGGSVLLQKPRSYAEVYNDVFPDIVNVFKVLRDPEQAQRLREMCELTPFARDEFKEPIDRTDQVEWARQVVFRSFAGFGSAAASSANYNTGFRANSNRSGTTPAHDWANWPAHIVDFVARLRGVVIENKPALEVIKTHDSPETLAYLDPPYAHSTRYPTKVNAYGTQEMNDAQHREMLEFVQTIKSKVVISGYRCEMYDDILAGWQRVDIKAYADGASPRTESLWMNYKTLTLF